MTSTGNLISLWEIEASKLEESSMCNQTSLGKFGLAVRPWGAQSLRQLDLGSLGPQDCASLVLTASPIFPRVIVLDSSNLLT